MQWPCNEKAPLGTPIMHIGGFVRGKGKFIRTEYVATDEKTGPRFPLLLTTGRILSQYNVGAQTRRTENVVWHEEDRLEIHPHDAEQRGIRDGDWVRIQSRAGETTLRALITERVAPGVVYTTFHHPNTQANVITTDFSDWATNCPEYKVTAVQVAPVQRPDRLAGRVRRAGAPQPPHRRPAGSGGVAVAARPPVTQISRLARRAGRHSWPPSRMVPEETPIALSYGGTTHAVMMASPADFEDFALGFSPDRGHHRSPDEIEAIEVEDHGAGIDIQIRLKDQANTRFEARRRRLAGPVGCGLCGIESIEEAMRSVDAVGASTLTLEAADIVRSVKLLSKVQPLHAETGAVHAAGFYVPGKAS